MPASKLVRTPAPHPRRSRVLVVDDDATSLEATATLLAPQYEVSQASSGRAAISFLKRIHFDVVCSDYAMPEMDGAELLRLVAAEHESTACVLIAAHSEYARAFGQSGEPDRFYVVFKPCAPDQLVDAIGRAAQRSSSRRRLVAASADAKKSAAEVMGGALSKRFKE